MNTLYGRRWAVACLVAFALSITVSSLHGEASQLPPSTGEAAQHSTPESQSAEKANEVQDENEGYRHSAIVRSLGAKLGMSPEAAGTTFEVANFAALAALIGWFLVRTLPKAFRNRNQILQKDLIDAKSASDEASARLSSVESRLCLLNEQVAAIRVQAQLDAALEEERMKASAQVEKSKILDAAEAEIAAFTAQAQRQLQRYAAELVIDQAAKKLVVTAETDRLLVQNFARRLAGDEPKGGQN